MRRVVFRINLTLLGVLLVAWGLSHRSEVARSQPFGRGDWCVGASHGRVFLWWSYGPTNAWGEIYDADGPAINEDIVREYVPEAHRFAGFVWGHRKWTSTIDHRVLIVPIWAPTALLAMPVLRAWYRRRREVRRGFEVQAAEGSEA